MRWLCATLLLLGAGAPAAAQDAGAPPASAEEPLFDADDAWIAAGFLAGAAALAPLDLAVADAIQNERIQANTVLSGAAGVFRLLGFPGVVLVSGGLYAGGLLAGERDVADIGLHTGTAIVVASAITYTGKVLIGRARPSLDTDDPFDLGFLRGWGRDAYRSFPSGHTTAAFAAAAALTTEISVHAPEATTWAGILLYGGAALVGISRLYHNEHWASDIVAGAAVGTFSGWKVTRYMHAHPNNELDRLLLPEPDRPAAPPRLMLMWSVAAP